MKKLKLLLTAFALLGGVISVNAQEWTDVTSTYITNASLVADYYSSNNNTLWPVYTTGRTGNTQHPKNWYLHTNGTTNHNINTGTGFFECWTANQGVKRWTLFQDVTLPAGTYRLTGQYSTNESRGIIKTVAITPHHSYYSTGITSSNWGNWGSETAEFTIYEETKVRIGMISTNFAQNHGFTLTTTGAKQLLADVIAVAPAGVSTTTAQSVYDDGGSDDAAYRSAAKTLHDAIVEYNIANASAGSPVDMTDFITDPSFEGIANGTAYTENKHSLMSAWSAPSVTDGGARSLTGNDYLVTDNSEDGFYAVNLWNSSSTTYYVQQTISGLPLGRYVLTATYASDASNTATLSMASAESTITATNKGHFVEGSVTYDHTAAGEVIIKLNSSKWFKTDNFKLSYLGDPLKAVKAELAALKATIDEDYLNNSTYDNVVGTERTALSGAKTTTAASETIEDYETAISSVQSAIDAFVAAKTNYDALVTEIAKAKALGIADVTADSYAATSSSTAATALTSTQNLKVAEYNYVTTTYQYGVDLGAWTKTGPTGSKNDQHWSDTTHDYLEQSSEAWASGSWTISYNQDLTLPAGNYVFKVSGRKAASDGVTLGLTVTNKANSSVLGTVNDFPKGDTGLGINKSGVTSFDSEDAAGFANGGTGRGWEWRYVKFTLASDATVNVSVDAVATKEHMWVSFCDATVQTDDEANISLIAYNIALASAETVIADDTYVNVTGSEKTDLQNAIDADGTLDKTDKDKIDAAKTALDNARAAFTGAKSNYDAYVAAKAVEYPTLAYAATAKRTALDDAQGAAAATSASDADTKTAAIQTAARRYYESHALAENVTGAEDKTDLISNPNFAGVTISGTTAGAWTFDQTGGNVQVTSSESFTDGSGNSSYSYFDYYNGSNNNQNIHQVISGLAPGRYMLTATGRGHSNFNGNLQLYVVGKGNVNILAIGNTGGVFNRGWNDASLEFYQTETADVTIGAKTNNSKAQWWGVTRFRLVRLGDAAENVTVSAAGFATYVNNACDLNFTDTEIKAYTVKVNEPSVATLTLCNNVKAGTPVLLYKEGGASENIPVMSGAAAVDADDNDLVAGTGATVATTDGDYTNMILNNVDDNIGFYFANGKTVASNRAYLHILTTLAPDNAESRMVMVFADEATGISTVKDAGSKVDGYYDLQGRRVTQPAKGLYIVNGKKVVIK